MKMRMKFLKWMGLLLACLLYLPGCTFLAGAAVGGGATYLLSEQNEETPATVSHDKTPDARASAGADTTVAGR